MNLRTIKTVADLPFPGVELVKVDKNITEVVIGGKLRIRSSDTYSRSLDLLVEAPFETAKRFCMTAEYEGFATVRKYFEGRYEAEQEQRDFESRGAKAEVSEVEVQIDDRGEVVEVANDAAPAKPLEVCDLPF